MIAQTTIANVEYDGSPDAVRAELERLGIAQTEAARLLRIDPRTMRRYLQDTTTKGHVPIPFPHLALLKLANPVRR